jgi:hypothetical protein
MWMVGSGFVEFCFQPPDSAGSCGRIGSRHTGGRHLTRPELAKDRFENLGLDRFDTF